MKIRGGDVSVDVVEVEGEELMLLSWAPERPLARGGVKLTEVEKELVRGVAAGCSNLELARMRGTSVRTIANQIAALLAKFGVASRHQLPGAIGSIRS